MAEALTLQTFSTWDSNATELFQNLMQHLYPPQLLPFKKSAAVPLPYFLHALFILKGNEPAGSACFYHNPHLQYNDRQSLLIGNFEANADEEVAKVLFSHADALAREMELPYIIGPMNGSTWEDYRLMVDTSPQLFFTEKPHPAYYNHFFAANGYNIISQYTSDISTQLVHETDALEVIRHQMEAAGLRLRELDLNRFDEELLALHALCSAGFQQSFLYTPIAQQDFIERYRPLRSLIDPAFAIVAEDEAGVMQALYLCLPDIFCREQKQLIIKTIVKHPQCHHKGIMAWMAAEIYRRAHAQHYKAVIHAFMQENARSNPLSLHFGGRLYRRYALYGKTVS